MAELVANESLDRQDAVYGALSPTDTRPGAKHRLMLGGGNRGHEQTSQRQELAVRAGLTRRDTQAFGGTDKPALLAPPWKRKLDLYKSNRSHTGAKRPAALEGGLPSSQRGPVVTQPTARPRIYTLACDVRPSCSKEPYDEERGPDGIRRQRQRTHNRCAASSGGAGFSGNRRLISSRGNGLRVGRFQTSHMAQSPEHARRGRTWRRLNAFVRSIAAW